MILPIGVADEETAVVGEMWVERQSKQPLLVARRQHPRRNVEKWRGEHLPILDNADGAALLHDKHSATAVPCVGQEQRLLEPIRQRQERNPSDPTPTLAVRLPRRAWPSGRF